MFVSEYFDAGFIHRYVQALFEEGSVQCCICGWLEFFEENIEAVLYLVEKSKKGSALPFTEQNINQLYQLTNG